MSKYYQFRALGSWRSRTYNVFKKTDIFGLFFVYFWSFSNKQTNIQFYNKLLWKNVYPVYGAGIWTHNLQNMSSLP